ncbi:MAG: rod shape-determining protein RodA [Candidatus Nealsonbacteria bacterium]|nr:rod shape-determining protein RodA [Candidatus Nealsonbacteria bacterium]
MTEFWTHIKKLDWPLIIISLLLVGMGLLALFSASQESEGLLDFKKQIIFLVIGLFLMVLVSFFDWRLLREDPYLILIFYALCLLLLGGLFFFAPEIRGVQGWYRIGAFSFDPIELTKVVLIVLLAKYFSSRHVEMYRVVHILISGFYVLAPSLLIFFQPDLGSVLVLLSLWIGILLISGIRLGHFVALILCGLLIFAVSWSTVLKDYQKERVLNFLQPQVSESLTVGWNQRQAKIAIGSGGFFGQGIGQGSQTQNGFLPEPKTDFIFSVIAEETGLIGVSFLLLLFALLIGRILKVSLNSQSNFCRLFAMGLSVLLLSQVFIHIGMNIGILPIIGIPLPLVSYGGSGLLSFFLALGILQSMKATR